MWTAATVVVCALNLLGRSEQTFPRIEFADVAPPEASAYTEAYVHPERQSIVLVTSSTAFREAQHAKYRCGDILALRKLASVIVHEEWHVRHGADEGGAYEAQLMALRVMGSGPHTPLYYSVRRSMITVLAHRSRVQSEGLAARR